MFRAPPTSLSQKAEQELVSEPTHSKTATVQPGRARLVRNELGFEFPFLGELFDVSVTQQAFDPEAQLANDAYDRYLARAPAIRPANAVKFGAELLRLEEVLGRDHLTYLSSGDGSVALQQLIEGYSVDSFGKYVYAFNAYVKLYRPRLHAQNGLDFTSFMAHEPGSLLAYQQTIPYIRSPHRLSPNVLPKLENNFKDQSKSRPLVVVVMSALDLDGSLHGASALDRLVSDTKSLVLAIEAGERLRDVSQALQEVAATYGQDNKIQDVVFISHESESGIELAGDVSFEDVSKDLKEDPQLYLDPEYFRIGTLEVRPYRDNLESAKPGLFGLRQTNKVAQFIHQLLRLFDDRFLATPRIIFDADFTNGHKLELGASFETPETQIKGALNTRQNLPELFHEHMIVQHHLEPGVAVDSVQIVALNGHRDSDALVSDPYGRPTFRSTLDPAIADSKIEYIRRGMDPEGILRAVVELWSDESWKEVEQRVENPIASGDPWTGDVIQATLSLALKRYRRIPYQVNGLAIAATRTRSLGQVKTDSQATAVLDSIEHSLGWPRARELYKKLLEVATASNSLPSGHAAITALESAVRRIETQHRKELPPPEQRPSSAQSPSRRKRPR